MALGEKATAVRFGNSSDATCRIILMSTFSSDLIACQLWAQGICHTGTRRAFSRGYLIFDQTCSSPAPSLMVTPLGPIIAKREPSADQTRLLAGNLHIEKQHFLT